jgi:hypothetical protein
MTEVGPSCSLPLPFETRVSPLLLHRSSPNATQREHAMIMSGERCDAGCPSRAPLTPHRGTGPARPLAPRRASARRCRRRIHSSRRQPPAYRARPTRHQLPSCGGRVDGAARRPPPAPVARPLACRRRPLQDPRGPARPGCIEAGAPVAAVAAPVPAVAAPVAAVDVRLLQRLTRSCCSG